MAVLNDRRHRVTLLANDTAIGSGGRAFTTSRVIADVWAAVPSHESSAATYGPGQSQKQSITIIVPFVDIYLQTQAVVFASQTYVVTDIQRSHGLPGEITLRASLPAN